MKTFINLLSLSTLLAGGAAVAQPYDNSLDTVPAKSYALEVTVAGSYLQGAGSVGGTMSSADLVNPGGGTEVSIGYRISPMFGIGAYGVVNGYAGNAGNDRLRTASIGVKADLHLDPQSWTAPWLSVGTGIKTMWTDDALDRRLFGIEVFRAQAGMDFRLTPWFGVGPVVSASVATFTREYNTTGYMPIDDEQVNLTLTAGLQGRFDLFGTTH